MLSQKIESQDIQSSITITSSPSPAMNSTGLEDTGFRESENMSKDHKKGDYLILDKAPPRAENLDNSTERRKENFAPSSTLYAHVQSKIERKDLEVKREPLDENGSLIGDINKKRCEESTAVETATDILASRFSEKLLMVQLQSIYAGNFSGTNLERDYLLRYLEDPFNTRYSMAFDVFYNTRRFFEQTSGPISDDSSPQKNMLTTAVTEKSIYGIYLDDSSSYRAKLGRVVSFDVNDTGLSHEHQDQVLQEPIKDATKDRSRDLSVQRSLVNGLQTRGDSNTGSKHFSSLKYARTDHRMSPSRKIHKRSVSTPRAHCHSASTFRTSLSRSPISLNRTKHSPLKPKAVMAWWKERDAATITTNALTGARAAKLQKRQSSLSSKSSISHKGLQNANKEKNRNPLKKLSALFSKHNESLDSLASIRIADDSSRSLHSLPSQIFLPECEQGTPSFITTNIVKNCPVRLRFGNLDNASQLRQISCPESLVRQRISSFEAPRPIQVEKRYHTSPSYQMLNAIKPVRESSLKKTVTSIIDPDTLSQLPNEHLEAFHKQEDSGISKDSCETCKRKHSISSKMDSLGSCLNDTESLKSKDCLSLVKSLRDNDPTPDISEEGESGFSSMFQDIYDAKVAMSSEELLHGFSEHIVTSTPLCNSPRSSPKLSSDDFSLIEDPRIFPSQIHLLGNLEHPQLQDDSWTSHIASETPAGSAVPEVSPNTLDSKEVSSVASIPFTNKQRTENEDNKENVAPDPSSPRTKPPPPPSQPYDSGSTSSRFARFEADVSGFILETRRYIRERNKNLQIRSLKFMKSMGSSDRNDYQMHRKRFPTFNPGIFKAKKNRKGESSGVEDKTSFRVLPTIDNNLYDTPDPYVLKKKSFLRSKLGRQEKPILTVPKYRNVRPRGSIFGLFNFSRIKQEPSFIVHQDPQPPLLRKTTGVFDKSPASKVSRKLSVNIKPFMKRSKDSNYNHITTHTSNSEQQDDAIEKVTSRPPRLELNIPCSSL